ncbi:hypothetical protein SAY87_018421 [Trapa incisa]|uniref:(S)-ureidoglycine aminohydrolase cupin domain-containing protein n=2 Tax=Trapa TaxID=22665 RepID=A0AAN7LNV6_TRANT|nr:hypothetical protein SAY87_018421 [Trapa incisa]KAK4784645.1 hypothetical protein SAY86_019013 [Trapa natans]
MQLHAQSTAVVIVIVVVSLLLSPIAINFRQQKGESLSPTEAVKKNPMVKEIHGVRIESRPPQSTLDELKVSSWPTHTSGPIEIPWSFKSAETMYLVEGKVKVRVVESQQANEEEGWFEIGGGDLVVFPKGMKIMWNVVEDLKKHYHLHKDESSPGQAS